MFNSVLFETSDYDIVVLAFKELLKFAGWSVPLSSDTISNNIVGDNITTVGNITGGISNKNAWFVVRDPYDRIDYLFQRGKKADLWWLSTSRQGFSGGTKLTRPTAIDESKIITNGFGGPATFFPPKVTQWYMGANDSGQFYVFSSTSFCLFTENSENNILIYCGHKHYSTLMKVYAWCADSFSETPVTVVGDILQYKLSGTGQNYTVNVNKYPVGMYDGLKIACGDLMFPWNNDDDRLLAPPKPTDILIVSTPKPQQKRPYTYKMIGRDMGCTDAVVYHTWRVTGAADFTGEKAGVLPYGGPLQNISVADKWR